MIESILELFGPFLIPVAVFAAGMVGYMVLVLFGRRGWL